ncbi:MAG: transposase [Syntrophaceae bacterium]|nr:transposase [Syntrophaceae bacterium]
MQYLYVCHHLRVHKQWRKLCSKNFVLLFPPAYSPELNPIERVRKLTRRLSVHNRYFPILSDVLKSVESQFDRCLSTKNDKLCVI